jgi:protein-glutamine gamma-glutamyltransferase
MKKIQRYPSTTLCSLALLLWGFQTGAWPLAIPMAIALEARYLINRRWTLSETHFRLIQVLGAFVWLVAIGYFPATSPTPITYGAGYHILKCLPLGFFPLVLAQTYCPNFSGFYQALWHQRYGKDCRPVGKWEGSPRAVGASRNFPQNLLDYPYFGICLIAASVNGGNLYLFLGWVLGLVTLLLGISRSRRFSPNLFYGLIVLALVLSLIGTHQFYWFQANVKLNPPDMFGSLMDRIATWSSERLESGREQIAESLPEAEQPAEQEIANETAIANAPQTTQENSPPQEGQSAETSGSSSNADALPSPSESGPANEQSAEDSSTASPSDSSVPPTGNGEPAAQTGNPPSSATNPNAAQSPSTPDQPPGQPNVPGNTLASSSLTQSAGGSVDPQQSSTQLGKTGNLQPADRILFRVKPNPEQDSRTLTPRFPLYLREASYNQYQQGNWKASNAKFIPQKLPTYPKRWLLGASRPKLAAVQILDTLQDRQGVLKLPMGTTEIDQLTVNSLQVSQYGTTSIQATPGKLTYIARFDPTQSLDGPPTPKDLEVPAIERQTLAMVVNTLNLQGKSEPEKVGAIATYFRTNFQYSLQLPPPAKNKTALATFLQDNRAGHCEYFASATSLLLRQLGIPTRYTVGYVVHEYSQPEQQYVVRDRNAHAWVTAYVNGNWVTVETTPGNGLSQGGTTATPSGETATPSGTTPTQEDATAAPAQEFASGIVNPTPGNNATQPGTPESPLPSTATDKNKSSFEKTISDAWSLLSAQDSKRWDLKLWLGAMIGVGMTLLLGLLFWGWRAIRRQRRRQQSKVRQGAVAEAKPAMPDGLDSEFYQLEKQLTEWGLARQSAETALQWMLRLQQRIPEAKMMPLNQIIDLHYRYRFDPEGISPEDRTQLKEMIKAWLMDTAWYSAK